MNAPLDLFAGVVPFVAAAEAGSIRAAARRLGVTPSAVTKAIQRLETRLGVQLLARTARSVRLTADGEAILSCFRDAVARAQAAHDLALTAQRRPQGNLRVTASPVLGRRLLATALPRLCERYPQLEITLVLTDRVVRFVEERIDVAIRIGALADSEAKAWRLTDTRWVTAASPAYLARRGTPDTPSALASHDCLCFLATSGRLWDWTFLHDGSPRVHPVSGKIVCDDGETLVAAAEAGAGIVQAMDFMVSSSIAEGRLVEVLPRFAAAGPSVWALAAPGRHRSPRVRAFVSFLQELFA